MFETIFLLELGWDDCRWENRAFFSFGSNRKLLGPWAFEIETKT